jgi:hypothetical protein
MKEILKILKISFTQTSVFEIFQQIRANDCHCKLLPGEPESPECPLPGPHGSAQPTTAPQGRTWANLELINF